MMDSVNELLDLCIVEHARDCLNSAGDLLPKIDTTISEGVSARLTIRANGDIELGCTHAAEANTGCKRLDEVTFKLTKCKTTANT